MIAILAIQYTSTNTSKIDLFYLFIYYRFCILPTCGIHVGHTLDVCIARMLQADPSCIYWELRRMAKAVRTINMESKLFV